MVVFSLEYYLVFTIQRCGTDAFFTCGQIQTIGSGGQAGRPCACVCVCACAARPLSAPIGPSEEAVGTFAQKLALIQRHTHEGVKLCDKTLYDMNCINTTKVP